MNTDCLAAKRMNRVLAHQSWNHIISCDRRNFRFYFIPLFSCCFLFSIVQAENLSDLAPSPFPSPSPLPGQLPWCRRAQEIVIAAQHNVQMVVATSRTSDGPCRSLSTSPWNRNGQRVIAKHVACAIKAKNQFCKSHKCPAHRTQDVVGQLRCLLT